MITSSQTPIYRIQSQQLRDALPIPNPQNPSLCIALEFVSITSNPYGGSVKLISVYEHGNNNLGYEILSLDIHVPYRWRAIDNVLPLPSDGRMMNNIQLFFRRGVAYCIRFVETTEEIDDIQVDIIDMVNETYIGRTIFPRERFMSTTLHLLDWNGHLSFAQLVKDELHVLKLDDHTKLKWAQTKRIIKLQCLKSYHKEDLITFHACDVSTLVFIRLDKEDNRFLCYYNINTGELNTYDMYETGSENTTDDAVLVAYYITQIGFHKAGL
uniref:F-box associated domain-containing protein n=1 Tax=Solanum tuberosum TaxID=4113 RepID=M1DBU2_SOLTU